LMWYPWAIPYWQ